MDLNKENIEQLKNNESYLLDYFKTKNDRSILLLLEKLGRLENGYSKNPLLFLLNHQNEAIRASSLKNLAKLSDLTLLNIFNEMANKDASTLVRREAVSAIGRFRDERIIPYLIEFLKDIDPKVILQSIRGLLTFSKNELVKEKLMKLLEHPNEVIKEVINKEYSQEKKIFDENQTEFPSFLKNVTVNGDVLDVLREIPNESFHLTFTSPPYYNARDYSIYQSYHEYLVFLESVFKEVYRTTKEGRYFVLNTSPIIIPRISRAHSSKRYPIPFDIHPFLVNMGWEFIDDIIWLKPEACVKDRNSSFRQHRKPLAYKANSLTEMLMVYRKKTDKLIDWNIKQYSWDIIKKSKVNEEFERTNVWKIDPTFDKIHSAVFPIELCNRVIKYYSMIGDLIFDPFAGSGTLAKAAVSLKRNFFLTEKEHNYFNRIKETLGFRENQNNIFTNVNMLFLNTQEFSNTVNKTITYKKHIDNNYSIVSDSIKKIKKKKNDANKNSNRKYNQKTSKRQRL